MFKQSDIANEIASSLSGKLHIVKLADAYEHKAKFIEALNHINSAAELLEKTDKANIAELLTNMVEKFAQDYMPYEAPEIERTPSNRIAAELQNQVNVLNTNQRDMLHIQSILENNDFEIVDKNNHMVRAYRHGSNNEAPMEVVIKADSEPGMASWSVFVEKEGKSLKDAVNNLNLIKKTSEFNKELEEINNIFQEFL